MRFDFHDLGEVRLHVASDGDPARPLIVFLHGFPEYWAAWSEVMGELAGAFHVVAPDQRGFNLSSKPESVDAYRAKRMVADLAALADLLSPGRRFVLAGHDWGASVAYAYAFTHPGRLSHLVTANGPHPWTFQKAIIDDPAQRLASQYINALRAEGMEERMAENGYARTERMIAGFSKTDWLNGATRDAYLDAWAQPGAMRAMLNWYRASPVAVPKPDETAAIVPLLAMPQETFAVKMPHLVVWGEADEALRPSCLEGLEAFAPDLTVKKIAGAGHWILHEKPAEVAAAIRSFIG